MTEVALVFPHQLFRSHPALHASLPVYLVEEWLFFRQYRFHQQKLLFHRASMQYYRDFLQQSGYAVRYIEAMQPQADVRLLMQHLHEAGARQISLCEVSDNWLHQRLTRSAQEFGIELRFFQSPLFLLPTPDLEAYFAGKKRFFQTDFYMQQRKRMRILLDENNKPLGGKWSFDAENRLKYPSGQTPPRVLMPADNAWRREAAEYIAAHFSTNYGSAQGGISYPVTHEESEAWLQDFVHKRLARFGDFEDAMVVQEGILHHSLLTPMLNVGLLIPQQILDAVLSAQQTAGIPLNSVEGFVRQIIGWREFIRGVYEAAGTKERTTNFWGFRRKIPATFWTGNTGMAPVDIVVRRVLATGYCHHIERLMVLGNFMLLCEFDPDEVYRWFMELFIDAYDWVMVPNVYGMSQFADGGLMSTKPYISGSNYLMKMSDFPKGDWQQVWDALFWRFMHTHRSFFLSNPRLGMLVKTFDKMPAEKQQAHLERAEAWLEGLDKIATPKS